MIRKALSAAFQITGWPGACPAAARRIVLLLLLCAMAALLPASGARAEKAAKAAAADATALPDPLTPEAVQALVARLSDTQVRELLLKELDAKAQSTPPAPEPTPAGLIDGAAKDARTVLNKIGGAIMNSNAYAGAALGTLGAFFGKLGTSGTLWLLGVLAGAILAGVVASRIYEGSVLRWAIARGIVPGQNQPVPSFPASIPFLARRLVLETSGAILALAVAAAAILALLPEREARVALTVAIHVWFLPQIVGDFLRFFLSPRRPELRIVEVDDATARFLTRGIVGVVVLFGVIETITRVTLEVGGDTHSPGTGFWLNTIAFVALAFIFLWARNGLRSIIRGGRENPSRIEAFVVTAYPAFAIIAIFGTWFAATAEWASGTSQIFLSGGELLGLALLLIAPMCDTLIRAVVHIFAPPMRGSGSEAERAHLAANASYVRMARVLFFGSLLLVLSDLWGLDLFGKAKVGVGEELGEKLVGTLLIVVVGYVLWEVTRLIVNRRLSNEQVEAISDKPPEEDDEGPRAGSASRMGTLLPPISWSIQVAIIITTALMALSHLGVNVTPLLAGAGILGIAIGFGAQKLVADVVSGIFFLIEDTFRVNEYVSSGDVEGTVEKLSVRSLTLRQSDGAINSVPYSNLKSITNFSRDWGTMKAVFTVPFDTDVEKVRKIFKRIGTELMAVPEYADAFIQPFKFKGVSQVNDVGIVVRGKYMFKPEAAQQFMIQRDIYRLVQKYFADAGIPFARREVHVTVGPSEGHEPGSPMHSAAAAGGGAVDHAAAPPAKP